MGRGKVAGYLGLEMCQCMKELGERWQGIGRGLLAGYERGRGLLVGEGERHKGRGLVEGSHCENGLEP